MLLELGSALVVSEDDVSEFGRRLRPSQESVLYICTTSALPAAKLLLASTHRGDGKAAYDLEG